METGGVVDVVQSLLPMLDTVLPGVGTGSSVLLGAAKNLFKDKPNVVQPAQKNTNPFAMRNGGPIDPPSFKDRVDQKMDDLDLAYQRLQKARYLAENRKPETNRANEYKMAAANYRDAAKNYSNSEVKKRGYPLFISGNIDLVDIPDIIGSYKKYRVKDYIPKHSAWERRRVETVKEETQPEGGYRTEAIKPTNTRRFKHGGSYW